MSFGSILQKIVDECGGGYSAALMGLDGIAIEQVTRGGSIDSRDPLSGEVTLAGVEFSRVLAEMTKASDSLGTGGVRSAVISLDAINLVFQMVDDDLMLVLALAPDGNLGKARYLIRRSLGEVREEL